MKTLKNTIILSIIVCMISLIFSLILEFNGIAKHNNYFLNIFLGVFASGTLVVVTSIVGFICEKRKYYINTIEKSSRMIARCLYIIEIMETQDFLAVGYFNEIGVYCDEIKISLSDYAYFFCIDKKEILIESILSDTVKFSKIQEELLKYYNQYKNGEINNTDYNKALSVVRNFAIKEERVKFKQYKDSIKSTINSLVEDRGLKNINF